MFTYKQLLDFCNYYNVRFEVSKSIIGHNIGMNNIAGRSGRSEWQWFWFESIGDELNDDTKFWFSHRYSQVNGTYNKGINDRINAIDCIERRMAKMA